ncbi:C40 family peptidase [Ferruginibacter sp. HRS2-29]|uniref:C40 family peptidase n=1 Tax=Ferruginibacter sp. HRS2-29 TaxID=2487334 RepID=UPI0020CBA640|nr:C40 family peptidase [Ferruginibacter sp. HRS2-29]MCP9750350.1 NlpC/P60 family protein [Ferruginibacter sp. HRS2-29]
MKNLFFVSIAISIFSGTSLSAAAQPAPRFITGIEFRNDASAAGTDNIITASQVSIAPPVLPVRASATASGSLMATESCNRLQFKFAQILEREVETLTNLTLLNFIDDWWGTRYRYGGTTRAGIDCSAFVGLLMSSVYGLRLPRTARDIYAASEKIAKEDMLEGDMVFFNTRGGVSHVGFYLGGGYFVHASVSSGVTISNLDESYYSKKFIGAARTVETAEMARLQLQPAVR